MEPYVDMLESLKAVAPGDLQNDKASRFRYWVVINGSSTVAPETVSAVARITIVSLFMDFCAVG